MRVDNKRIINLSILCLITLACSGCRPILEHSMVAGDEIKHIKHDEILIEEEKVIAIVYFDEDAKLLGIKDTNVNNKDKGIEAVYITESGFYPERYYIGEISCIKRV